MEAELGGCVLAVCLGPGGACATAAHTWQAQPTYYVPTTSPGTLVSGVRPAAVLSVAAPRLPLISAHLAAGVKASTAGNYLAAGRLFSTWLHREAALEWTDLAPPELKLLLMTYFEDCAALGCTWSKLNTCRSWLAWELRMRGVQPPIIHHRGHPVQGAPARHGEGIGGEMQAEICPNMGTAAANGRPVETTRC